VLTEERLVEIDARPEHFPRNAFRWLAEETRVYVFGFKVLGIRFAQVPNRNFPRECELFTEIHGMRA
jgi:hypothetical protein